MKTKAKFLSVKDTTISFLEFVKKFSTEYKAFRYLEKVRWDESGIVCPYCGEKITLDFLGIILATKVNKDTMKMDEQIQEWAEIVKEQSNDGLHEPQSNVSLINEMARVGDLNNELEVYVRTDDGGNLPHFHIWDKNSQGKEFHTCVQIKQPVYFHHDGKEGVLNSSQRKELVDFLKSKPTKTKKFSTFWEAVLTLWNMNNSAMDVDEDQPMPDYTNIADNK